MAASLPSWPEVSWASWWVPIEDLYLSEQLASASQHLGHSGRPEGLGDACGLEEGGGIDGRNQVIKQTQKGDLSQAVRG